MVKFKNIGKKKVVLVAGIVALILVVITPLLLPKDQLNGVQQLPSQRTVERSHDSVCNYRREHPEPSGDAATAEYYKEIERRSPADIVDAATGLRKTYEKLAAHPEKRMSLALDDADANDAQLDRLHKYCQTPLTLPKTDMNGPPIVR